MKDSSWESLSLTDVGRDGQRTKEPFSLKTLSIESESDDESESIDLFLDSGMGWSSV